MRLTIVMSSVMMQLPVASGRAGAVALVLVTACSSPGRSPVVTTQTTSNGTRVAFAGVSLTVPADWRIRASSPAPCGSVIGRTAYVYVGSSSPPRGCSAGPATGPYVVVKCHPYGPGPTGSQTRIGPFSAIRRTVPNGSVAYLVGRDTEVDFYGTPELLRRIQSSVRQTSGSC
jgi:hypothetical protein